MNLRTDRWRIISWTVVVIFLLVPIVATQFSSEMKWGPGDFGLFSAMVVGAAFVFDLMSRKSGDINYRSAVGVSIATAVALVWMSLAVGIIGSEDNTANLMYSGVLAVLIIGAVIARLKPNALARTLIAAAIAQFIVAVIAHVTGQPAWTLNGIFIASWVSSAWLFRKAALKGSQSQL